MKIILNQDEYNEATKSAIMFGSIAAENALILGIPISVEEGVKTTFSPEEITEKLINVCKLLKVPHKDLL